MAKIIASLVVVVVVLLSAFAISCGSGGQGGRETTVPPTSTVVPTSTQQYPPRLQELVDMAQQKIDNLGIPYASIFRNDIVDILYDPNYQDYPDGPTFPAFVVVFFDAGEQEKVQLVVEDFFAGLDVDISTLNIREVEMPGWK